MIYNVTKNNFEKLVDNDVFDKLCHKHKSIDLIHNFVETMWSSKYFFGLSKIEFDNISNVLTIKFKHSKFIGVPRGYSYNFQDFIVKLIRKLQTAGFKIINLDIIGKNFSQCRDTLHIQL